MPKKLPQIVEDNLAKCCSAAIAAVEAYNRPGSRFRTAQFLVIIVIAWTALFHAIYYTRRKRPWYPKKNTGTGRGIRYQKVDGEPKHWDLSECLKQYYGSDNPPEKKNLQFLIGLRNKIEHWHLPELDAALYGECQAAVLNLEALLVEKFGRSYALMDQLTIALQFSQVVPEEQQRAARVLARSSGKTVKDYVERFRGGLPSSTLNSMKYSFNVYLVPRVANRKSAADAAVQFVHVDEASSAELERLEKLNVLIKEKHIPITNVDCFKPSQVVERVQERLPYKFTMGTHITVWKYYNVRPGTGAHRPEATRSEYCYYDAVHGDYVYTKAWVEKLIRDLSKREGYRAVTGRDPEPT